MLDDFMTRERARRIVREASQRTEVPFVKGWLFEDSEGKWESVVARLLLRVEEDEKEHGIERVDNELADNREEAHEFRSWYYKKCNERAFSKEIRNIKVFLKHNGYKIKISKK